jgi:hypothetical protein
VFKGVSEHPMEQRMRGVTAELPDDPTDEQVDAWIELAELMREPGFIDRLNAMSRRYVDGPQVLPPDPSFEIGDDPDALIASWAAAVGRQDDETYRRDLLEQLEEADEPRAARYWQLLSIINGWALDPSRAERWSWLLESLRMPR